jgi:CDP-diglyceride synthetase
MKSRMLTALAVVGLTTGREAMRTKPFEFKYTWSTDQIADFFKKLFLKRKLIKLIKGVKKNHERLPH